MVCSWVGSAGRYHDLQRRWCWAPVNYCSGLGADLHVGCVCGGQEQRSAQEQRWVQGPVFPSAALCGLLLSQECPTRSWLWEGWHPSMQCPYEMLQQLKKTPPKLINGQARKEEKESCFSDGRFPVGLQGFSGDIPKVPWCCFSVFSLSQARRYQRNSWNKVLLWGQCSYHCSFLVTIWYLCCQWLIQLLSKHAFGTNFSQCRMSFHAVPHKLGPVPCTDVLRYICTLFCFQAENINFCHLFSKYRYKSRDTQKLSLL